MQKFFSRREWLILEKAARLALPYSQVWKKQGGPETVERLDTFFCEAPPHIKRGYKALVHAFDLRALPVAGKRFLSLEDEDALQYMWNLHDGPMPDRALLRGLLTPLKVAFFDDPEIFAAMGIKYKEEHVAEPPPRYMQQVFTVDDFYGEDIECDVVIVGSGAGGAAAAFELASAGLAVVIVEEGKYFTRKDFNRRAWQMEKTLYRDYGATLAVGNTVIPVPVGKTVGGTTTINSGTCYRTPPEVVRRWKEELGINITYEELEPIFERVEAILKVEPAKWEYLGGSARVVKRGADKLGLKRHGPLLRNAPDCDGQGVCIFGCPTGAKRSADVSLIPAALQRAAVLLTEARVTKVLFEGNRAVGVVASDVWSGKRVVIRSRAVILACGALHTPLLLMQNRFKSPQLGKNLSIHPAVGIGALFDEILDSHAAIPQGYAIEDFKEEGILFEGATPPFDFASVPFTYFGRELIERIEKFRQLAVFGFLIEDSSRGRIVPTVGFDYRPTIIYYLNRRDQRLIKRGMNILVDIFRVAGAREFYTCVQGIEVLQTDEDIKRFKQIDVIPPHLIDITAYHPLGSCRMGAEEKIGVVKDTGETFAVENLFIADGSIVPAGLGVNPQITIMTLAMRVASAVARKLES